MIYRDNLDQARLRSWSSSSSSCWPWLFMLSPAKSSWITPRCVSTCKRVQLRNDTYSRLAWLEANLARQQGVERIRWLHDSHDDQSSLEPPSELRSVWLLPGWSPRPYPTRLGLRSSQARLECARSIASKSHRVSFATIGTSKMSAEMADAILDWLDIRRQSSRLWCRSCMVSWPRSQKIIPRNGPMLDLSD